MDYSVGKNFAEEHLDELREFLYQAQMMGYGGEEHRGELKSEETDDDGTIKRVYASGVTECIYLDGGTKIVWVRGDFRFSDKYFGGEPYGGMSVVRYKGRACFTMTYHGEVKPGENKEFVYGCLKEALMAAVPDLPIRGPRNYVKSGAMDRTVDLEYTRVVDGDLTSFSGSEHIAIPLGRVLYEADFIGGLMNLR